MAEWSAVARRLPRLAGALALVCAATMTAAPAMASAPTQPRAAAERPLLIPGGFRLPASNGYTLYGVGVPSRGNRSGNLMLVASAKGRGVIYKAPAEVTETSIQADLGDLGAISVSFQPSGRPATTRCNGESLRYDSGRYEGTIRFHGEGAYAAVEASSAPGSVEVRLGAICGEAAFVGAPWSSARGATLDVRNPGLGAGMSVEKLRPGSAAEISAWTREYTGAGISIERHATLRMPAGRFAYDRRLRTATVRPPSPFSGSARFDRRKKAGQRWSGDLTVDLPGSSDVPLTGPNLRAILLPG